MSSVADPFSVEEFHGPYGSYHVSELVLQRIWLRGAFDASALRDSEGRRVVVESPGNWNRLEGPDFKGAVLLIGGRCVVGDVEAHFSQSDWRAHGHERDARYDNVVLHVVYHIPRSGEAAAVTKEGRSIPCVSLLDRLWYSLEEYASEDSIVASTGVDLRPAVGGLLALPVARRRARLVDAARRRWIQKRHYASLRIERLGWRAACHQSAMEIMGYARNRIPMLALAQRYPLEAMALGDGVELEVLWGVVQGKWRLNGSRPANHPKLRLEQYLKWVARMPDWPDALLTVVSGGVPALADVGEGIDYGSIAMRRQLGVSDFERRVCEQALAGEVGGSKASTLVCDGFLPLCAAKLDVDCFDLWFHWLAGNVPDSCLQALKQAEILQPRKIPLANGWVQGVLGMKSGSVRV